MLLPGRLPVMARQQPACASRSACCWAAGVASTACRSSGFSSRTAAVRRLPGSRRPGRAAVSSSSAPRYGDLGQPEPHRLVRVHRIARSRRSPGPGRSRPAAPAAPYRPGRAPCRGWSRAWRTRRRRPPPAGRTPAPAGTRRRSRAPCTAATDDGRHLRPDGEAALEPGDRASGGPPRRRRRAPRTRRLAGDALRREHAPVQAGRERRPLRAQHDDADRRVQRLPHRGQRRPQARRLGVAPGGVVQGQRQQRAVLLQRAARDAGGWGRPPVRPGR